MASQPHSEPSKGGSTKFDVIYFDLLKHRRGELEMEASKFDQLLEDLGNEHWREVHALQNEITALRPNKVAERSSPTGKSKDDDDDYAQRKYWQREEEASERQRQYPIEFPRMEQECESEARQLADLLRSGRPDSIADLLLWEEAFERRHPDIGGPYHLYACLAGEPNQVAQQIRLLFHRGQFDPVRKNKLEETPLQKALHKNASPMVIEALLEVKSDPNMRHGHGETPVHIAVRTSTCDTVEMLLRARASPSEGDAFGETALMEAASKGDLELCRLLMAYRADLSQTNQFELTAVDFAEDQAILDLFREQTATQEQKEGTTSEPVVEEQVRASSSTDGRPPHVRRSDALLVWSLSAKLKRDELHKSEHFNVPGLMGAFIVSVTPKTDSRMRGALCDIQLAWTNQTKNVDLKAVFCVCRQEGSAPEVTVPATALLDDKKCNTVGVSDLCTSSMDKAVITVKNEGSSPPDSGRRIHQLKILFKT